MLRRVKEFSWISWNRYCMKVKVSSTRTIKRIFSIKVKESISKRRRIRFKARIKNFKIFRFTTISKDSRVKNKFKMFVRDVLNEKSNKIYRRTSNNFCLFIIFINVRESYRIGVVI